ncbi:MAG: 2-amino-4-hydroxy-6-hydroxymethyldihydropteridine diphosphokinase [Planctomycetota bacterium]|jgi:2-amino-4-hydroxy-6-hydroxymethyldihydropteridine diphosphokinase
MPEPTTVYIALGSNLGNRQGTIKAALKMLAETPEVQVVASTDLIETAPLSRLAQPKYLNAVAQIQTSLNAEHLHKRLHAIETSLGRTRHQKWAPRTIDLDLLLFDDETISTPHLTVPHPQMHLRSFVLSGLCRLNGDLIHPALKVPLEELAARLNGADFVLNSDSAQLVSIAGIIGVGKTTLAKKLDNLLNCKAIFEAYDKNPFLPDVYAGKKVLALDSQLYFLTSRIEQLNPKKLPLRHITVSDYIFDKELIYAKRLLNTQQLALYETVFQSFEGRIASPVLVIYLQDSVERCLDRIRKRNRPYEQKISPQFLKKLNSDYERLFAGWKSCPVIRIPMSNFDCSRKSDIKYLANQVKSYVAGPSVIASAPKQSKM